MLKIVSVQLDHVDHVPLVHIKELISEILLLSLHEICCMDKYLKGSCLSKV